jgi:hypothetical protein
VGTQLKAGPPVLAPKGSKGAKSGKLPDQEEPETMDEDA